MLHPIGSGEPPKFGRPPVSEVAIAIEFASLPNLNAITLVKFHEWVVDSLPNLAEQPVLPPSAPLPGTVLAGIPFGMLRIEQWQVGSPLLRTWMTSESGDLLLQMQHDRLVLNWRRPFGDATYPSYDELVVKFESYWTSLLGYLVEVAEVRPNPLVAEVTFVNDLLDVERPSRASDVISLLADASPLGPMMSIGGEWTVNVQRTAEEAGICSVSVRATEGPPPSTRLAIVTRVSTSPNSPAFDDISTNLRFAHDVCTRAFREVTTEAMHERWEIVK